MWQAFVSVVLLGLVTTATVSTVVTNLAFLSGERGVSKSGALLVGWEGTLLVVFALGLTLSSVATKLVEGGGASGRTTLLGWGETVLGLGMIGVAVWGVTRGKGQVKRATDKAFTTVDTTTFGIALWLGVFYGALNWVWTLSAAAQAVRSGLPSIVRYVGLPLAYLTVASLSVLVPLALVLVRPSRAGGMLGWMRRWMIEHGDLVVAVTSGAIGVAFLAKGLAQVLQVS